MKPGFIATIFSVKFGIKMGFDDRQNIKKRDYGTFSATQSIFTVYQHIYPITNTNLTVYHTVLGFNTSYYHLIVFGEKQPLSF